jgi:hypothetical protein
MQIGQADRAVNFCGASGASYRFEPADVSDAWTAGPGIVLFAAGDCAGWRIIDVAVRPPLEASGLEWRWRKARRYGASSVFVRRASTEELGHLEAADLRLGLDPVFSAPVGADALAA